MNLTNRTSLDSSRLAALLPRAVAAWPHQGLEVTVRYSRRAEFSGTCYYQSGRIYINVGRHNQYPYLIRTAIAKAQSDTRCWRREIYTVEAADGYELVLFVFLHEFYHWLVKKARRNVRQKEARCDRFAAKVLVDQHSAIVRDPHGRIVPRSSWDFQDLDGFVAAARRARAPRHRPAAARKPIPSLPESARPIAPPSRQLWLFDL